MTNTSQSEHPVVSASRANLWRRTGALLALVGLVAGCVPVSPSDEALASSIVLTKRAPNVNFGTYRTFYLRPEIRQLGTDGTGTALDDTYAAPLLAETKKQLTSRGFEAVDDKSQAELAVEMVHITSEWVATSCYSWWNPYYWGYPGWGYYPYYGGCSASTWKTNTLATLITDLTDARTPQIANDMIAAGAFQDGGAADGRAADAGGADAGTREAGTREAGAPDTGAGDGDAGFGSRWLAGIWFSGVYGIVFSTSDSMQKGLEGIKQAFVQSPYLANY